VQDPASPPPPAEQPQPTSTPAAHPDAQRRPEPPASPGQAPDATAPIGASGTAHPPRWGEQGFQAPPDPGRQSRKAAAWIAGVVGVLGLIAAAVIGFSLLVASGDGNDQSQVGGASLPSQPGQGDGRGSGQGPGQAPGQGPGAGGAGSQTTVPGQGGRVTTPDYSIKLPDGFQDVTDAYRSQHPTEGGVVQSLTQADAPVQPAPEIRISPLPNGFGSGQSLDRIARTRAGALVQTPDGLGAMQHSTLGPDPSVEVGLSLQSGGHRLEVLVKHAGRVWEISVIDPGKGQTTAAQAWQQTIKPGWQWPA
jgi:hypothetical protein